MSAKTVSLNEVLSEKLRDPKSRQAYEELEPAHQVARLRIMRGLTQAQLAELVGAKQPSIARLESGQDAPRLSFLKKAVGAPGGLCPSRPRFPIWWRAGKRKRAS
jgi:DNA-binding XRE family transcriptional regulator